MPPTQPQETPHPVWSSLGRFIGRTRLLVFVAVIAVLIVAVSLFLQGTIQAVFSVWKSWEEFFQGQNQMEGENSSKALTVQSLEIVSVMLKAVVFYLIGVGLYSLFIAPLNLPVALGIQTLNDLETKVVSVVIVILAVTFLEHFIVWQNPLETLQFGAALSVTVAALVLFQWHNHQDKVDLKEAHSQDLMQSRRDMFAHDKEEADVEVSTATPQSNSERKD